MRNLLGTLFVAGLLVAGANAQEPLFRMFFDTSGNAGSNAAPHPGSGTLSYDNPVLPPGGGRLYIYGQFQRDDQTILSPNFDIEIDCGTITGAWNYNGPGQDSLTGDRRSDAAAPNPVINPGGNIVSFTSANLTHMGFKNANYADNFDVQHDNARNFGDTLLGYVDVSGPGPATVWITIGQQGFAILGAGPETPIYMGFGDEAPRNCVTCWWPRSKIPEATIGDACDPCDMNCDGDINAFDIEPFLDLLFDPNPTPCDTCTGDTNGDGLIDAFDIEPFLECLFP